MMISYAQNFEDVLLQRSLGDVERGFYVDVGAHHPYFDSVTKWFYDHGWSGINVEPVPHLHALLEAERTRDINLNVAAGREAGTAVLQVFPESPGLSTLNAEVAQHAVQRAEPLEVQLRPLRDILAEVGDRPIHFLKIDVEGAERDVLEGMDFTRFRPWILVIESAPPDGQGPTGEPWEDLVLPFGYRMAWFDGLNRYYLAEEHIDRLPRLAQPPHVFDHFELAITRKEREAREASEQAFNRSQQHIATLDAALAEHRDMVTLRDKRIADLGRELEQHSALISQRDERIATLDHELERHRQLIAQRDALLERELERHRAMVVHRDERIATLDRELAQQQERIAAFAQEASAFQVSRQRAEVELSKLRDDLAFQREVIKISEQHINAARQDAATARQQADDAIREAGDARSLAAAYLQSTSWRATAPLRAAIRVLRRH